MNDNTTMTDTKSENRYFRRIDWSAFWTATGVAFLVYLFTLGPSVGLEDSGELATAADHLGVPHPPGYPFWSLCGWIFCRLFSWVTYMGHPTPAWAMSLFSAVAGAFAAGCAAMLICRSGSDMLDSMDETRGGADNGSRRFNALLAFAAGVGGSLVFAFSPVEWSQSTIVEIYSLNALFLMAVFLLSYRWMRRPSDKVLWLTAFIFGLGLTNYQVLLLAALPLAIIIALKDIRLFRDFMLILIPVGLTAKVLEIGCKLRASQYMSADVINKFEPLKHTDSCPNEWILGLGIMLVLAAPVVGFLRFRRAEEKTDFAKRFRPVMITGFAGVALMVLSATVFAGKADWFTPLEQAIAPLLEPAKYAWIGAFLAASCVCALGFAFNRERKDWRWLGASIGCGVIALFIAASGPSAGAAGYQGVPFAWGKPTLLLVGGLLALFALAFSTPRGLAYAVPVASVQIVAYVLLAKGGMNGLTNPHSWWFLWPIAWNFAIIGLAAVTLPGGRSIAPAMLFAELGVSFYAYMPIVSDLRNPPMNWGYPRTWEGFKHAIMRGQYEAIKMPDFFSASGFSLFLKQMGFYFQDLRMQFTLVAAGLALIPFALWKATVGNRRFSMAWIAAGLYAAVAVLVTVFSELFEGMTGGEVPLRLDKLLLLFLALIALVGVALMAVRQTAVVLNMIRGRKTDDADVKLPLGLRFLMDDVSQQWLIAVGACFGIMSLFLVALAGVKGDIQDGFIQKVKFISSHGMFALWIGYGLLVGGVLVKRLFRQIPTALLMVAMMLVAFIPVYENYTNDQLVFAMGSAEQNGHTFGWQFGAYQLEGADEIRDELEKDEEPLPNPLWPERMEDHSIFFGGTDPGRFVPTYMIYSADFRPDVYLITQNALADDTYMSVERDLYGDEIWIPSKEDSAESFNIYVNEVQSGKRQANADLKIENGRVQVTGALGVMEINGVLTKMMFDHERLRHAFYVEESYVIQWMYPYLTPHGLIMKIEKDPGKLNADITRNDMEFWDWYMRRLLHDPAFRRDFPGQKSFSKLRAAIAGLYAHQGRYREAAQAYAEAVLLYPASPEATFRYIQEILMPMRRWDSVMDLLDYTDRVDPNNSRAKPMRDYVSRLVTTTARITSLREKERSDKATLQELLDLAQDYASLGQNGQAVETIRRAMKRPESAKSFNAVYYAAHIFSRAGQRGDAGNAAKQALALLPPNADPRTRRDIAPLLADGGYDAEAADVINEWLRSNPKDTDSWLELCQIKAKLGQTRESQQAFIQAYQSDAKLTMTRLQASEALQRIAEPLFKRK